LQDALGRFQDREIQAEMVQGIASDMADATDAGPALAAIDVLVKRLADQQDEARAEFTERFAAFASPDQRALVKKTFPTT
jgi:hypothetical protein